MKRKRWMLAILGIVLALAVTFYAYLFRNGSATGLAQDSDPDPTTIPQTMARRGDLTVSIRGSGELAPVSSSDLSFGQTGTLLEMHVAAGDQVQAGELLARLKLDLTPAEHQAKLTSAQLAVIQAQQNLDQLVANADLEAAQALSGLETSQAALDDLSHTEMKQAQAMKAVATANQAVSIAEMNLYILQSMPSQQAVDIANASLLFKQKDYQDLLGSTAKLENQIKSAPNETVRDRLENQLIQMQITLAQQKIDLDNASYKVASMGDPGDPASVSLAEVQLTSAQAELAQAQRELISAQAEPNQVDMTEAELNVREAQAAWERVQDGPDPVALQLAETQLAEARAKLALVEQEELVLELKAPFNGTILSVKTEPGDRVDNTTAITLANLSQSIIEVSLDENDLIMVQTGMEAQVVFDALPEVAFSGQVIRIDPSLQLSGNTYSAHAWVRLDQPEDRTSVQLPLGLNANVEIFIGKAANAVLVPVEAIHQLEDGTAMVYVIWDSQPEQRLVTIGLMDLISAEITSGLQAGEIVTTGAVELSKGNP